MCVDRGAVGAPVIDDGLGDHGLVLVQVYELLLGVHLSRPHEVTPDLRCQSLHEK